MGRWDPRISFCSAPLSAAVSTVAEAMRASGVSRVWRYASRIASRTDATVARRPLAFAVGISCVKAVAADAFAQCVVEGHALDPQRAAVFAIFGAMYCGAVQHGVYFIALPACARLLGASTKMAKAATQLALDQGLHSPLLYFPSFYATQALVAAASSEGRRFSVQGVVATWKEHILSDYRMCLAFWLPANGVNFYFVARHLRVPYIAATGLLWLGCLSWVAGGRQKKEGGAEAEEEKEQQQPQPPHLPLI